ncbi:MAG TPA: exodeoxyribonuclease VII large subunit [Terriglobales bacterium]|nr:exodeoxyribonuclease VII large subunit [Terriglobales bacterium]
MASSGDQLGLLFQPARQRVWKVCDLVSAVRTHLEREYSDLWVEGEISNYRPSDSGHLYFTLKDDSSQARVVMFRSQAKLLRFRPQNGMQVIARGRVTIYDARGELQISAEYLEPKGAGALQIAFEQLKARLEAEGLFETARKKPIPSLPRRIGLVTSPRGAAIRDILNILRRRHQNAHVLIYPAQVQGEAAASEVTAAVRYFNRSRNVEVIIVARGGGSVEDLAAFNNEGLARAVATSEIPVISAIGHETDFTIIDFVADLRAPTPSAAAELVIRSQQEIEEHEENLRRRLARALRYQLLMRRQALTELAQHGAFARITDVISRRQQKVDDLSYRLLTAQRELLGKDRRRLELATAAVRHHDLRRLLLGIRRELHAGTAALAAAVRNRLLHNRSRLESSEGRLQSLSPLNILERGYALVFDPQGKLVKDSSQVKPGEEISARLARGELSATVKKIQP